MKAELNKPEPPAPPPATLTPEITIPLDIKGLKIGMDGNEIRAKLGPDATCVSGGCYRMGKYTKVPNELDSFAGSSVASIFVDLSEDKLVRMRMTMSAGSAHLVFSSLTVKYGKPMREESEFKTKGGLTTTKVVNTWKQGDVELVAEAPSGKIDEMHVTMSSRPFVLKEVEKMKEKSLKDL